MAVLRVEVAPVVVPFVQVALLTDGIGMQAGDGLAQFFAVSRGSAIQCFIGCGSVGEQLTQNDEIGRTAIHRSAVIAFGGDILVFGRRAGCGNQFARLLGVFNKPLQHKVACTFHEWEERFSQVIAVACEVVLFPKVA